MLKFDYRLVESLAVLEEAGTFVLAAGRSGLTQSAFSQRIQALEILLGSPLVIRSHPCKLTQVGHQLVQHYKRVANLEKAYLSEFEPNDNYTEIAIALNAESYEHALKDLPIEMWKKHKLLLHINIIDEDQTIESLKMGKVVGCISTSPKAPHGCLVEPFSRMIYHLVGSPKLIEYRNLNVLLRTVPLIRYSKDDFLHKKLVPDWDPIHSIHLPSPSELLRATIQGVGLCILPEVAIREALETKLLVDLLPKRQNSISLYWHYQEIGPPSLKDLTKTLLSMSKNSI